MYLIDFVALVHPKFNSISGVILPSCGSMSRTRLAALFENINTIYDNGVVPV